MSPHLRLGEEGAWSPGQTPTTHTIEIALNLIKVNDQTMVNKYKYSNSKQIQRISWDIHGDLIECPCFLPKALTGTTGNTSRQIP
jgi:hypothetical protein